MRAPPLATKAKNTVSERRPAKTNASITTNNLTQFRRTVGLSDFFAGVDILNLTTRGRLLHACLRQRIGNFQVSPRIVRPYKTENHLVIGSACTGGATAAALALLKTSASLYLNSRASWHVAHALQHVYAQHAGQSSPSKLNCERSFLRSEHPMNPWRHSKWDRQKMRQLQQHPAFWSPAERSNFSVVSPKSQQPHQYPLCDDRIKDPCHVSIERARAGHQAPKTRRWNGESAGVGTVRVSGNPEFPESGTHQQQMPQSAQQSQSPV